MTPRDVLLAILIALMVAFAGLTMWVFANNVVPQLIRGG